MAPGFGIGVIAPGWDPMSHPMGVQSGDSFVPWAIPGCAAAYCTNSAVYGSGVVAFPADPLVDGNMEAVGTAAWTNLRAGTLTKEANPRPGSAGAQCLRVAYNATPKPAAYQNILTNGNTYTVSGWARGDGAAAFPRCGTSDIPVYDWEGTTSTTWQQFSFTVTATAGTPYVICGSSCVAAGWVEFDDVTVTPKNVSQLTDLSGNGRHLLQTGTAAWQPLWVTSGTGGILRFDGVSDTMKANPFALVQPTNVFILSKPAQDPNPAQNSYLFDGNSMNSMGMTIVGNAPTNMGMIAGGGLPTISTAYVPGAWHVFDGVYNGNNSAFGVDGAVPLAGPLAVGGIGGFTLSVAAGLEGTNFSGQQDVAAIAIFNRVLSEPDRQRVVRWMVRQAKMLGVI